MPNTLHFLDCRHGLSTQVSPRVPADTLISNKCLELNMRGHAYFNRFLGDHERDSFQVLNRPEAR